MSPSRIRLSRSSASHAVVALPLISALVFIAYQRTAGASEAAKGPPTGSLLIQEGMPVPEIPVRDGHGKVTSLGAVLGRRPAMVLVIHPECGHCHGEVHAAIALQQVDPGKAEWMILSVGDPEITRAFAERYPEIMTYHDAEGQLQERFGLSTVPVTLSVDRSGKVHQVRRGAKGGELRSQYEEVVAL